MVGLDWLNAASPAEAEAALYRCCGCAGWARAVASLRPFQTEEGLYESASREWAKASREDILEAFSHHPRIGDRDSLRARFPGTAGWAATEQSGATLADEHVLDELAEANDAYEARFAYIFIVCATGKTAAEMLALLRSRLPNEAPAELEIASGEQMKITRLRLAKLLQESGLKGVRHLKSPITTHVLDTSIGKPAANVRATLERIHPKEAVVLGSGVTNADGRIADLFAGPLERGRYRITFDTGAYFAERSVSTFFPEVSIVFEITDTALHHHVPLLLSPFGYSTYRGS